MTEREPTKRKENDLCIGEKKDECVCVGGRLGYNREVLELIVINL
jgi:hypothetical protein